MDARAFCLEKKRKEISIVSIFSLLSVPLAAREEESMKQTGSHVRLNPQGWVCVCDEETLWQASPIPRGQSRSKAVGNVSNFHAISIDLHAAPAVYSQPFPDSSFIFAS